MITENTTFLELPHSLLLHMAMVQHLLLSGKLVQHL